MLKMTDYRAEMLAKIDECDEWLNGEEKARTAVDVAHKKVEEATIELELAKAELGDYTNENRIAIENYKADLQRKLGIEPPKAPVVDTDSALDDEDVKPVAYAEPQYNPVV